MSIYAQVFRPSEGQQSFLARERKRERKRRRLDSDEDSDNVSPTKPSSEAKEIASSSLHPVHKTDPYNVAGFPREWPLPTAPFPHAAVRSMVDGAPVVDEELARLKPPLYAPKSESDVSATSQKRKHVDTLTTILHTCMLRSDWQRASRVWGLLLRTEIAGRGMDVRHHGRWTIGPELLMRRNAPEPEVPSQKLTSHEHGNVNVKRDGRDPSEATFTDEGFSLARNYYERLILQYPHNSRSSQTVSAAAFYPALFNIWVFEVQDRSKRARKDCAASWPSTSSSELTDSTESSSDDLRKSLSAIRQRELAEALPIARRADELMLSPPYDTSVPLLRLRAMIGLWLFDLYRGRASGSTEHGQDTTPHRSDYAISDENRRLAELEKVKALALFRKVESAGGKLPESVNDLMDARR